MIFFIKLDLKWYKLYGRVNMVYGWYTKMFYSEYPSVKRPSQVYFFLVNQLF